MHFSKSCHVAIKSGALVSISYVYMLSFIKVEVISWLTQAHMGQFNTCYPWQSNHTWLYLVRISFGCKDLVLSELAIFPYNSFKHLAIITYLKLLRFSRNIRLKTKSLTICYLKLDYKTILFWYPLESSHRDTDIYVLGN